jgi:hypothetical protein
MVVQYAESEYVILDDTMWHDSQMAICIINTVLSDTMFWCTNATQNRLPMVVQCAESEYVILDDTMWHGKPDGNILKFI